MLTSLVWENLMNQAQTLDDLFAEVKQTVAKQKRDGTFGKSRKKREKRLSNTLLVKEQVNAERYKILTGTLHAACVHAQVREEVCSCCKTEVQTIRRLCVIMEDKEGNHYIQKDNELNSRQAYLFNKGLPLRYNIQRVFVPLCFNCLVRDYGLQDEIRS